MERDASADLISSDRVSGTKVYATDGEELGSIDHLMIGKRSGRVEYSVMSFGGFLGINEKYHPIPWDALDYDTEKNGYVVNIDKSRLKDAPSIAKDERSGFNEDFGRNVYAYYGVMY
ncbi:PRC-barrel domain-containing protein [Erythrobacter sp. JGD-13]|uniref:PRC-barrel domain-containing protein n=2 Tax=Erythrobacteraceae TaxID=335929 RepID=A0ABS0N0K1_9SPHN|nr:PRC-barrel domain-containing protein [Aurantiacibacter sp. MUD61]MBH5321489.1 PRC-barrel domain-containing protein [Aurantiacibacter sediminis]